MPKNVWKFRKEFGKVSMALEGGGERKVQGSRLGVAYKSGLWRYQSVALWKVTTIETDGRLRRRGSLDFGIASQMWEGALTGKSSRDAGNPENVPKAVRGEQNRPRESSCGRGYLPEKEAHFGKANSPAHPMYSGRNQNLDRKIEMSETRPFLGYHLPRALGIGSSHQFGAVLVDQFEKIEWNGRMAGRRD